jgi:hypothetical protein
MLLINRPLQVDFVKLLHDKLMEMSLRYADTPDEWRFPRPSFKVCWVVLGLEGGSRRYAGLAALCSACSLHCTAACRLTILPAAPPYRPCRW